MAAKKIIILVVLLSLLSLSCSLPSNSISNAIEILSNSGFVSMALTLEFGSKTLIPQSPSLTVFCPSDSAFASSGQPSLSLLQLHFSPRSFSPQSLKSLPFNFKIPTLSPTHSLIVTSPPSDDCISLNGIKVNNSVIFDDGSLRIFGIDKFFDPNYNASRSHGTQSSNPNLECITSAHDDSMSFDFDKASKVLREKGYTVMASFLELQLAGIRYPTLFTVFAPPDEVLVDYFGNFSEYSSVFFRHVVPCTMPWSVLLKLDYPTVVPTFLEGYNITIKVHDYLTVNKVPVVVSDIYLDRWISIHGIRDILPVVVPPDESSQIRTSMVNLKVLKVSIAFFSLFLRIFGF